MLPKRDTARPLLLSSTTKQGQALQRHPCLRAAFRRSTHPACPPKGHNVLGILLSAVKWPVERLREQRQVGPGEELSCLGRLRKHGFSSKCQGDGHPY